MTQGPIDLRVYFKIILSLICNTTSQIVTRLYILDKYSRHSKYSNNFALIGYNNVQTCGSATCFGLVRLSSGNKAIPVEACSGAEVSRRLRLPEFLDNRHMKVVRLSALSTGRL
jgi:hypothetical protein